MDVASVPSVKRGVARHASHATWHHGGDSCPTKKRLQHVSRYLRAHARLCGSTTRLTMWEWCIRQRQQLRRKRSKQCVPVLLHRRQNHRFVIFHVPDGMPSFYLANATRPWLHPLSDMMVFRMAGANRSPADPASTATHLAEDVYACHSLEHARARGQGWR